MQRHQRSPLLLMALTILIDFTGFGLILPMLPFWAQHLGAGSISIGLVLSVYAAAQFVFTPILGTLSDRYGRKPIILLSLLIEALSLAMTALAPSLPILLLARLIGGLGASNIGSAQAVVADVTAPSERARGMGFIGAAIGLGFVIGPALGGGLAPLGETLPLWVAAGIALVNAALVALFLPETRRAGTMNTYDNEHKSATGFSILSSGWRNAMKHPLVLRLIMINLLFTLAFTAMESIFALFTQHTFGWGAAQNGYLFTFVGVIVVIMQGGLVGQLVKHWGEQRVLLAGLLMLATGLLVLAFSTQLSWLLIGLGILSIGDGAVTPTVSTLLSFVSTAQTQGETLGFSQGMAGLSRSIAPLVATSTFALGGPATPFIGGGILVMLAAALAFTSGSSIHKATVVEPIQKEDPVETTVKKHVHSATQTK